MSDDTAGLRRQANRADSSQSRAGSSVDSMNALFPEELAIREKQLRQAQLKAEEARKRYEELLEFGPWGCIRTDPHGEVTWTNGTAQELLGLQAEEFEGRRLSHLVHASDQRNYLRLLSQIARGRKRRGRVEVRLLRQSDEFAYVQMEVQAFWEAGRFGGWQLTFMDIDPQKRLETELRRSIEKYSSIFRAAREAIIVFSTVSGKILEANPFACHLYGYEPAEILHLSHLDLSARPAQALQAVTLEHNSIPVCQHKRKDGSVFSAEVSISYFDQQGTRLSTMVVRDITRRQEAEQSLRESNAALKALLKQRELDRTELEESLLDNVQQLVLPYVEKLQTSRLSDQQRLYVEMLASQLKTVTSPFIRKLSSRFLGLTPTELRVAELIRQGRTSKEIAEVLVCSETTVLFHRQNIRKKLGIKQQKVNLQSYLVSLS